MKQLPRIKIQENIRESVRDFLENKDSNWKPFKSMSIDCMTEILARDTFNNYVSQSSIYVGEISNAAYKAGVQLFEGIFEGRLKVSIHGHHTAQKFAKYVEENATLK